MPILFFLWRSLREDDLVTLTTSIPSWRRWSTTELLPKKCPAPKAKKKLVFAFSRNKVTIRRPICTFLLRISSSLKYLSNSFSRKCFVVVVFSLIPELLLKTEGLLRSWGATADDANRVSNILILKSPQMYWWMRWSVLRMGFKVPFLMLSCCVSAWSRAKMTRVAFSWFSGWHCSSTLSTPPVLLYILWASMARYLSRTWMPLILISCSVRELIMRRIQKGLLTSQFDVKALNKASAWIPFTLWLIVIQNGILSLTYSRCCLILLYSWGGRSSWALSPFGSSWHCKRDNSVWVSKRSNSNMTLSEEFKARLTCLGIDGQTVVYGTWIVPKRNDGFFLLILHRNVESVLSPEQTLCAWKFDDDSDFSTSVGLESSDKKLVCEKKLRYVSLLNTNLMLKPLSREWSDTKVEGQPGSTIDMEW